MNYTLTQLRVRVRQLLKLSNQADVNEGDPSQAEITSLINECFGRVWSNLGSSTAGRKLQASTTATYTAQAEVIAIPSSAISRIVYGVQALPPNSSSTLDRFTLDPITPPEKDNYDAYGVPEVYFMTQGSTQTIGIRPVPNVAYTLYIDYFPSLTALSADGDIPTQIPGELHQMLAYGAAAQYLTETNDETDHVAMLSARYDSLYEDCKNTINAFYPTVHFQRVNRRR